MTTVAARHYKSCGEGTGELEGRNWEGTPGKEILEANSENRRRRGGRDMAGQTVPSTGSSNREGPIADGVQPCTTDSQRQ